MLQLPSSQPGTASDRRLLELIGDSMDLVQIDEFRLSLLHALRRAVPADWVGLSDVGPDPESIAELIDPPLAREVHSVFAELAYQNPLVERYARTRDSRALRISDLVSQEEFHSLEVYQRVYRRLGVGYQMAFMLPHSKDRILGVHLSRRHSDFTGEEVALVEAARPFLIQAYRNAIRYSNLLAGTSGGAPATPRSPDLESLIGLGLTARQARVLQLAATGARESDIAAQLKISRRTVQKHLERIYRAFGVNTRADAIAHVTQTVPTPKRAASGSAGASGLSRSVIRG